MPKMLLMGAYNAQPTNYEQINTEDDFNIYFTETTSIVLWCCLILLLNFTLYQHCREYYRKLKILKLNVVK